MSACYGRSVATTGRNREYRFSQMFNIGLTGGVRYWDEPRDAGRFSGAGIFDAREGFGGGGEGEERCIRDGSIPDSDSVPLLVVSLY